MQFCAVTAAIIMGAVAERGRLLPAMVFVFIWATIVYCPLTCWVWNTNGWGYKWGVMDYAGGGSVGLVQMTTEAQEMPTYLQDDWQRDWGVLDKLTTYQDGAGEEPKQVVLEKSTETRSGTRYRSTPSRFTLAQHAHTPYTHADLSY